MLQQWVLRERFTQTRSHQLVEWVDQSTTGNEDWTHGIATLFRTGLKIPHQTKAAAQMDGLHSTGGGMR